MHKQLANRVANMARRVYTETNKNKLLMSTHIKIDIRFDGCSSEPEWKSVRFEECSEGSKTNERRTTERKINSVAESNVFANHHRCHLNRIELSFCFVRLPSAVCRSLKCYKNRHKILTIFFHFIEMSNAQ